jgi:hypothetical protein
LEAQIPIEGFDMLPSGGNHVDLKEIDVKVDDDIKVYYTLDGTPPTRYSRRLKTNKLSIYKNTVFRFLVIDKNGEKQRFSQSYIIKYKHSLPILSISSDPAHFFDSLTGIYAMGCCADTVDPYMGANFWKEGWERPIHIEYYTKEGKQVLNQPCGVKIFGGYSKSMRQKSLALFARSKYGENKFRYPIFSNNDIDKYNNIVLRNAGGDMLGAHMRDIYATQLVKETGLLIQEYQPAAVYINGEYWGKYNLREKINEHFIHEHFDYSKDSIIIMRHNGDHQYGPPGDYRKFIRELKKLDLTKKEDLSYVNKSMDIANYITYNICEVYTGNGDAGGNIRYYKSMRDTGKWRWIFYDLDMGMNINGSNEYKHNTLKDFTVKSNQLWPNPPWSTFIIRKILKNDSLRNSYINRFCDLLNTTFHPQRAQSLVDTLVQEVATEIPYHLKRWRITKKRYDKSVSDIKLFAKKRPGVLFDHLRERFDLSEIYNLKILWNDDDRKKGKISLNSLAIEKMFSGKYFKTLPITLNAVPSYDYEFVGWEGIVDSAKNIKITSSQDTLQIRPIFKKRPSSKLKGSIVISEVNALPGEGQTDWIELYNLTDSTFDLSGFQLRDSDDQHVFIFPDKSIIGAEDHIIITQDKDLFCKTFECDTLNVIGSFQFGIGKSKDKIRFYDNKGNIIDKVKMNKLSTEAVGKNWSKKDFRIIQFSDENWVQEKPNPGRLSAFYSSLLKKEEKDKRNKLILFYTGIGTGTLAIILFFAYFVRQHYK